MSALRTTLFALLAAGCAAAACTPRSGYSYCRSITVQAAQVPSTQTNFTWLICANLTLGNGAACQSVAGLNQTGAGAHVTNANGYDIVLTSDSAGTTLMNWEAEAPYSASTGAVALWALSSSLSSGSVIYMSYGNALISTFQGGASSSAWNSAYKAVYHMPDGSSLSLTDSTGNSNNGTASGTLTAGAGQIAGGGSMTSGNFSKASPTGATSGDQTWSGWINSTSATTLQVLFDGGNSTFQIYISANKVNMGSDAVADCANGSTTLANNTWYYVSAAKSSNACTLYLNGASEATGSVSTWLTPSTWYFANQNTGSFPVKGAIDENRFSNTGRAGNWVATEYNNMSAPATFATFGSEAGTVTGQPFVF